MVLDECPKLTKDKKILSKAINVSTNGQKDLKLNSVMIKQKALFGIAQGWFN